MFQLICNSFHYCEFIFLKYMFIVVVWFCCSPWLAFLILADLINLSIAAILNPLIYLRWRRSFCLDTFFLQNTWAFGGFLFVPHLVDNYAKNVDERGRNIMCERTLPSFLVMKLIFLVIEVEGNPIWPWNKNSTYLIKEIIP